MPEFLPREDELSPSDKYTASDLREDHREAELQSEQADERYKKARAREMEFVQEHNRVGKFSPQLLNGLPEEQRTDAKYIIGKYQELVKQAGEAILVAEISPAADPKIRAEENAGKVLEAAAEHFEDHQGEYYTTAHNQMVSRGIPFSSGSEAGSGQQLDGSSTGEVATGAGAHEDSAEPAPAGNPESPTTDQ